MQTAQRAARRPTPGGRPNPSGANSRGNIGETLGKVNVVKDLGQARMPSSDSGQPCRACGACCAYSRDWPRFSTEDEEALALIPAAYADHDHGRMCCAGDRCSALAGTIGVFTTCMVYPVRPEVCRACQPGDDACATARRKFGLAPLP
jgi:hypothetical protein